MAIIYKVDKRRTVPRWRSYEKTSALGELALVKSEDKSEKAIIFTDEELLTERFAWERSQNLTQAGNLLSSAFVLDLHTNYKDVAKFVIENDTDLTSPLNRLAKKVLGIKEDIYVEEDILLKDISSLPKFLSKDINTFRNYLKREPKNAIAWIELGRLYSIIGKREKAQRCILTALAIDKDNRYVARSSSRFFHHFERDNERALYIIKQSEYSKNDPWLISADIVYSSILNRNSKLIKNGLDYLAKEKTDFFSVTELASSIGTIEAMNGKLKKAKQHFQKSLIAPNDNSLAQISWMIHDSNIIQEKLHDLDIPCAFEVKAQVAYDTGKYQDAFNNAYSWLKDEPFSTRPVRLASYISGVFLNKANISVMLLKFGLTINPDSRELLNDLIYFLIQNNQTEEAINLFKQIAHRLLENTGDDPKLVYTATAGLILYKEGYPQKGEELYLKAIKQAEQQKNYYLLAIGLSNYVEQEIEAYNDYIKIQSLVLRLKEITKGQTAPDVIFFRDRAIEKFDLFKASVLQNKVT